MSDRKESGVAFWAIVLVVVALVGYPWSFGPACWLCDRGWLGGESQRIVYWPIRKTVWYLPDQVRYAFIWWGNVGSRSGIAGLAFLIDFEIESTIISMSDGVARS